MKKNELIKEPVQTITKKNLTWVNVIQPTRDKIDILAQRYPFHELNLDDCLSKIQIPKIDKYQDHMFIILHFPTYFNNGEEFFLPIIYFTSINTTLYQEYYGLGKSSYRVNTSKSVNGEFGSVDFL